MSLPRTDAEVMRDIRKACDAVSEDVNVLRRRESADKKKHTARQRHAAQVGEVLVGLQVELKCLEDSL